VYALFRSKRLDTTMKQLASSIHIGT
jgi:hypothetical protein